MNWILQCFRMYHGWDERRTADELGMTLEMYQDLERGSKKIDGPTAEQLANLYNAPAEVFYKSASGNTFIIYSHCRFNDSNGYVNHLYPE